MTTGRRTEPSEGGSWLWAGGEGGESQLVGRGQFILGEMEENHSRHRRRFEAVGRCQRRGTMVKPYQQPHHHCLVERQLNNDSDLYPRPRLRWTPDLHDQFVKAVDELGGANS
ncbi:hypothetical protein OROMI_019568 [Orobanche minor]